MAEITIVNQTATLPYFKSRRWRVCINLDMSNGYKFFVEDVIINLNDLVTLNFIGMEVYREEDTLLARTTPSISSHHQRVILGKAPQEFINLLDDSSEPEG